MDRHDGEFRRLASDFARHIAAQRRRVMHTCPVCGREMEGVAIRRYCSNTCRTKAYRQRREVAMPHTREVLARLAAVRARLSASARPDDEDVVTLLRRAREERTAVLMGAWATEPEPSA